MPSKPAKSRVFQERTNYSTVPSNVTTNPFLIANELYSSSKLTEIVYSPREPLQDSRSREQTTRRWNRYSKAQQELAKTFQHCSDEPTPQDLQVEALRRATAALATHAAEAQESVEKLRKLLANHDTDPGLYRSMQCQRWKDERRRLAADQLSRTLQQHITFPSIPPAAPCRPPKLSIAKRNDNLVRFFDSSNRRARPDSRRRRRPCQHQKLANDQVDESLAIPRVHNHAKPLPLLLTTSRPRPPLPFIPFKLPASLTVEPSLPPPSDSNDTQNSTLDILSPDGSGTATIWRETPRSTDEILAGLHVTMPEYAVELLAEFDSNSRVGRRSIDTRNFSNRPSTPPPPPRTTKTKLERKFSTRFDTPPSPSQPRTPSRKRISALFSLENISYRLGSGIDPAKGRRMSTSPPLTVIEEPIRPIAVSFSGHASNSGPPASHEHGKPMLRLGRRISALTNRRN